jgi:hypothetical protein
MQWKTMNSFKQGNSMKTIMLKKANTQTLGVLWQE